MAEITKNISVGMTGKKVELRFQDKTGLITTISMCAVEAKSVGTRLVAVAKIVLED